MDSYTFGFSGDMVFTDMNVYTVPPFATSGGLVSNLDTRTTVAGAETYSATPSATLTFEPTQTQPPSAHDPDDGAAGVPARV